MVDICYQILNVYDPTLSPTFDQQSIEILQEKLKNVGYCRNITKSVSESGSASRRFDVGKRVIDDNDRLMEQNCLNDLFIVPMKTLSKIKCTNFNIISLSQAPTPPMHSPASTATSQMSPPHPPSDTPDYYYLSSSVCNTPDVPPPPIDTPSTNNDPYSVIYTMQCPCTPSDRSTYNENEPSSDIPPPPPESPVLSLKRDFINNNESLPTLKRLKV